MVAAFVLITGVLVVLIIGAGVMFWMGMSNILALLVTLAPWLVMVGTILLILAELPLFLGGKEDRRAAFRDLRYLVPTCLISAGLWYVLQMFV